MPNCHNFTNDCIPVFLLLTFMIVISGFTIKNTTFDDKFAGLGIRSFAQIAQIKWATVRDSLRTNEQLWANHSGRSCQKSNRERIAPVAHDKWATMSDSLRLLICSGHSFAQVAHFKWANKRFVQKILLKGFCLLRLKKNTSDSLIPSFLMSHVRESLRSLTKNERCEQIAQVTHQKWAMWAIRSSHSQKMSNHERIAQVAHQKWVNHSFFCKKRAIRLINRWANSQPCKLVHAEVIIVSLLPNRFVNFRKEDQKNEGKT